MSKSSTNEPVAAKAVRPAAEPHWAAPVRAATREVEEVKERHRHAQERLSGLIREERAARRAQEDAETAVEFGRGTDADLAAAAHRAEEITAEVEKAERLAAGIARVLDDRRAALDVLTVPARSDFNAWTDDRLVGIDAEYRAAVEVAVTIAARALAIADAAGAQHIADSIMRLRLPGSLIRADAVHAVGLASGKTPPRGSPTADTAARLAALIRAAERAAAPPSPSTREAA